MVADRLWAESGLQPSDVQTAVIYDPFTPFVLLQLEEFGFCGRGESAAFVRDTGIEHKFYELGELPNEIK